MPVLLPPPYGEMGSSGPVHSQGNSCCGRVWTLLPHVQIQSMYCGSYRCNLCASETIQVQPKASHICHTGALPPVAPSELCGSMKQSSDHHTLDAAAHQSPSHSCIPVAR